RRAEAALCRHSADRHHYRALRLRDLETGAVARTDPAVRRIRRGALCPLLRDGGNRCVLRGARHHGAARAEIAARDGPGQMTTKRRNSNVDAGLLIKDAAKLLPSPARRLLMRTATSSRWMV